VLDHAALQLLLGRLGELRPSRVRRSRLTLSEHEIPQGTGSGFIWDQEGHAVTNFHVIQGGSQADVTLNDNTVWKAKIVGVAEDNDLAVLQIVDPPKDKLRPTAIGTSNNLQVGQKVFAIGTVKTSA
jgi:S1-C subfamily serine protease